MWRQKLTVIIFFGSNTIPHSDLFFHQNLKNFFAQKIFADRKINFSRKEPFLVKNFFGRKNEFLREKKNLGHKIIAEKSLVEKRLGRKY